jgi:hypothetical protein
LVFSLQNAKDGKRACNLCFCPPRNPCSPNTHSDVRDKAYD